MTELITHLADISDRYDVVFCDLWGCLHNGKAPFPAAVAALQAFRAKGGRVVLMTNAPRPRMAVERQLAGMGLPRDAWDIITASGDAAQAAMLQGAVGRRVFHIGAEKDMPFFDEITPENQPLAGAPVQRVGMLEAEGVVCTGLADDQTETPEDYRTTLLLAKSRGLPMLCANPDIVVDMGERRVWCAGALAEDFVNMGGTVSYYGKPHPPIYDLARARLGLTGGRILCIGDGIATDIQGAEAQGLDALFITGGIAAAHFGPDPARPDKAALEAWLAQQRLAPRWSMPFLA
jgi:HAD superfamily hydrolase (TIGR01459 family)